MPTYDGCADTDMGTDMNMGLNMDTSAGHGQKEISEKGGQNSLATINALLPQIM
jgi:hypothetical protein